MVRYHLTLKSANRKVGAIPVSTTGAQTCPDACPLKANGCYADGGPLAMHWAKVTNHQRGTTFEPFLSAIRALPDGQLWRHNQAGDLPGINDAIDAKALRALVDANAGKRGFTYTHKPVTRKANRDAIAHANANGFTVNLSGNSLAHADTLAALDIGPVVAVVPMSTPETFTTPKGRKGIVCPAQTRDNVSCASCGLCARSERRGLIIGFRAHGSSARKAEAIAKGE